MEPASPSREVDPSTGPSVAAAAPAATWFAPLLIAWQREHGRHALPWQQLGVQRDAYRVWLAEIMLQQTQVAAVVPYYLRFVERFADVRALAEAPLDDVMRYWSGLGYYSRARNLHAAAQRVVAVFDGTFPDNVDALQTLPGIGRSTAGAIAAFAHGRRAAILDGNVKRVLSRVFLIDGSLTTTVANRRLWALSEALLPDRDIERYTQGLMDLGATVCTPRRPACLICPFERRCVAHREGREQSLPEKSVRKALPQRRALLLLITRGDRVFVERRPPVGIWGGLWSLPEAGIDDDRRELSAALEHHGRVLSLDDTAGFVHGFTHFVLHADVLRVRIDPSNAAGDARLECPDDGTRWVTSSELADLGMPTPIRSLLSRSR